MRKIEAYKLIEKYLNGQLDAQALSDFEQQLATDPFLSEELRQFKEVSSTLRFYNQRSCRLRRYSDCFRHPAERRPVAVDGKAAGGPVLGFTPGSGRHQEKPAGYYPGHYRAGHQNSTQGI